MPGAAEIIIEFYRLARRPNGSRRRGWSYRRYLDAADMDVEVVTIRG